MQGCQRLLQVGTVAAEWGAQRGDKTTTTQPTSSRDWSREWEDTGMLVKNNSWIRVVSFTALIPLEALWEFNKNWIFFPLQTSSVSEPCCNCLLEMSSPNTHFPDKRMCCISSRLRNGLRNLKFTTLIECTSSYKCGEWFLFMNNGHKCHKANPRCLSETIVLRWVILLCSLSSHSVSHVHCVIEESPELRCNRAWLHGGDLLILLNGYNCKQHYPLNKSELFN